MSGQRRITALVAAPACAALLWVGVLEGYRTMRPEASLFRAPASPSLADAILHHDIESAFATIRNGQDPNRPLEVSDGSITGGRTVRVSPLLLAVASDNDTAVRMLVAFGARAELPPDVGAACLADTLDRPRIAQFLRQVVPAVAGHECVAATTPDPSFPLLAFTSN